jgi:hypothetical protein
MTRFQPNAAYIDGRCDITEIIGNHLIPIARLERRNPSGPSRAVDQHILDNALLA